MNILSNLFDMLTLTFALFGLLIVSLVLQDSYIAVTLSLTALWMVDAILLICRME